MAAQETCWAPTVYKGDLIKSMSCVGHKYMVICDSVESTLYSLDIVILVHVLGLKKKLDLLPFWNS